MNDHSIPENILTWSRMAGFNELEIFSTTIEERLVRFTEIVIGAARDECIDVVARNGGSVEIERAIRNLRSYGMAHTSSLGADAPVGLPAGETTGPVASAPTPVAWMHTTASGFRYFRKKPQDPVFNPQPVYTHPPQDIALREAAQEALTCMYGMLRNGEWYAAEAIAERLRAALGDKE